MPPKTSSSTAIPDIQDLLESILSRLQSMEEHQSNLTSQVARIEHLSEAASSPAVTAPQSAGDLQASLSVDPKLKVGLPDKFDGNPAHYEVFIAALDNFFTLKSCLYSNEEIKVRTVGTLLSHHALQWFGTLVKGRSNLLKDYGAFMDELKRLFSDPNAKTKAQILLKKLKQGGGSVIMYSTRFRTIVIDTGYNEEAKMAAFRLGLSDQIKDILATNLSDPETLEDLISLAIKIDTRIFDRKMETLAPGGGTRGSAAVLASHSNANASSGTTSEGIMALSQNGKTASKSKKRISNQERQRRIQNNLCLYCGEAGHTHSGCPKKGRIHTADAHPPAVASIAGDPPGSQQ